MFATLSRLNPRTRSLGFDDPLEDFEREILGMNLGVPFSTSEGVSRAPSAWRTPDHLENMFCDLAPLLGIPLSTVGSQAGAALQPKQAEDRGAGQVAVKPIQERPPRQGALSAYVRAPPVDVVERPNEYIIHLDVPGVPKENIKLHITEDRKGRKLLTISGERKDEHHDDETQGFRSATALYGPFSRSLRLPKNVATDNIVAKCENGVLYIAVPKMEAKPVEPPVPQEIRIE